MAARRPLKTTSWCFTINNPQDGDTSTLRSLGLEATYLVYGSELGESGTRHYQGFVVFKNSKGLAQAKQAIGGRGHLEPMRGTPQQASDYCKKDGDFVECGTLPKPGRRTDLDGAIERLNDTRSLCTVAQEFPSEFVKYGRGLINYFAIAEILPARKQKTICRVYVGPPGVGKSRRCLAEAAEFGRVYYKPNGKWWDGYIGQEAVILDDFYGGIQFHELLNILDMYDHRVEYKGGYMRFVAIAVFISSNRRPSEWYKKEDGEIGALYRRFTEYRYMRTYEETEDGLQHDATAGHDIWPINY